MSAPPSGPVTPGTAGRRLAAPVASEAGGLERDVTFAEPAAGVHADIDEAYHAKYDQYGSRIVSTVVGPEAAEVTIKLEPRSTNAT